MKTLHKCALAVASTAVIGLASSGIAQAGALSYAHLLIDGLSLQTRDSFAGDINDFNNKGTPIQPGQLGVAGITNTSNNGAVTLDGNLDGPNIVNSVPNNPAADALMACTGDCAGIGENNYTQQFFDLGNPGNPLNTHFSRSDSDITGAAIIAGNGRGEAVTEIQLNSSGNGTSTTQIPTISSFEFTTANGDERMVIDFSAQAFVEALVQDNVITASVLASTSWGIQIFKDTTGNDNPDTNIWEWNPQGNGALTVGAGSVILDAGNLQLGVSASHLSKTQTQSTSGNFRAVTTTLTAGTRYSFNVISILSGNANVVDQQQVSAPATLSLLGIASLGLAGLARRRRKVFKA